jgi:tubulin beta
MQRLNVYFNENEDNNRFIPRGLMVDLEPGVLDSIKAQEAGRFFNPDNFINGVNGAGNNYASGFYSEGSEIVD